MARHSTHGVSSSSYSNNHKWSSPKPPRQACDICRERKVRCDRAEPKCSRCTRLGQSCGYDGRRRLSRDDLPGQVLQLQDRLAKAEALLLAPRNPVPPAVTEAEMTPAPAPMTFDQATSVVQPKLSSPLGLSQHVAPDNQGDGHGEASKSQDGAPVPPAQSLLDADGLFSSPEDGASWLDLSVDWSTFSVPTLETQTPTFDVSASLADASTSFLGQDGIDISAEDLTVLHGNYFDIIYYSLPFLNKERFLSELSAHAGSPSTEALRHAVALIGCTLSPQHTYSQQKLYTLARNHADECERGADDANATNINLLQALLFIIRFEIIDHKLTRAWITLGRAVRISKLLNLHHMDREIHKGHLAPALQLPLYATHDPLQLEERRRSFWLLYILESYFRTRTGMECELGDADMFDVYLPSPGLLAPGFQPPARGVFIRDFSSAESSSCIQTELSSYAGCILMVELALRCFDHMRSDAESSTSTPTPTRKPGFWDSHYALVQKTDQRFAMLQAAHHLNAKSLREDPIAFSLYMNLRATEIAFHEAAIAQVQRQGLPVMMAAESQKRSVSAASKIANAVRLNYPNHNPSPTNLQAERDIFMLQATFIAWPLVMAMKALSLQLAPLAQVQAQRSKDQAFHGVELSASVRLLLSALDCVEEAGGYWHGSVTAVPRVLQEWDERNGAFNMTL